MAIQPIRFENGQSRLLAGIRRWHRFEAAEHGIRDQWRELQIHLPLPGQISSVTYGAICDSRPGEFEYLSGVEVENLSTVPKVLGKMRLQEQYYAIFRHSGRIASIRHTWTSIFENWLPNSQFRSANRPDFERYDERFDPMTASGDVEVWVAIQPL